jgi:glycine oxidase
VRGEVLWVHTREVQLQRPVRFMHPRYKLYVVPKPGQHFIIGATEIESEDRSPISLRSNLELSSALYALNPAFAEARITTTDVNLRPALMDNLPRIERQPGLVRANGLYRHGYLLAPAVVEALTAEVLQQQPSLFSSQIMHHRKLC